MEYFIIRMKQMYIDKKKQKTLQLITSQTNQNSMVMAAES